MPLDALGRRLTPREHPPRLGHHKTKLTSSVVARETPKLRPCLAPGHHHLILSTRACRICDRGRDQIAKVDPIHGFATGFGRANWIRDDG